ncbi:MAG TPA: hypothetical protein VE569_13760 [Acidimicrobiia bacterium]|jgi:hypothetical protein|nr:hypothetical protein [Acidimicrobiia bacterium]
MRTVVVFTLIYTVVLLVYGTSVDSSLTYVYTGINIGLFALFGVLHIWVQWPTHALWGVSIVGMGNMLGGVLLVDSQPLYMARILGAMRYDKVFHAAAAAAMVAIAWEAIKRWSDGVHHLAGQLLLAWLVVMGGGAVVEIAELIGSTMSQVNVGDYGNNALDLVANGTGALVGVAVVWWLERRAPRAVDLGRS